VGDHVDPCTPLVVALDNEPRGLGGIGVDQHLVLGPRVVLPTRERLQIHRRELPLPHGVRLPGAEPDLLLGVADGEPVLAQEDAVLHQQPLEDRALVQKPAVLLGGTQTHDPLDTGTVVPAAVKQHDLPGGRQLLDIPLEVPLSPLPFGGDRQSRDAGHARVEVLRDPLDRAALSRRVASLEDHDDPFALGTHPFLQNDEISLQTKELLLVHAFLHQFPSPTAFSGG
jgi:hypothetical protein